MFFVSSLITAFSGKNSFPTTFRMVYKGTAIIIPKIPDRNPVIKITRNISKGCELTLLEKMMGCDRLLSMI